MVQPRDKRGNEKKQHQLQLDWSGRQNLLREWLVDDTHVKHLLRILFDHTPVGESDCWLLLETICREMSAPRRTVQRAISQAKVDGLLIVFGQKGRRRCNTYRLRMAEIRERARLDLSERTRATLAPDTRQCGAGHAPNRRVIGANVAHRSRKEVPNEPPPPKCNAGVTPVAHSSAPKRSAGAMPAVHPSDEWSVVVVELIQYGIQDAEPAAAKARSRGCSAPFVRRVIEYARTKVTADGIHAWGAGALRRRILNLVPGQEIDDDKLWLPPSPEYVAASGNAIDIDLLQQRDIRSLVEWSRDHYDDSEAFHELAHEANYNVSPRLRVHLVEVLKLKSKREEVSQR